MGIQFPTKQQLFLFIAGWYRRTYTYLHWILWAKNQQQGIMKYCIIKIADMDLVHIDDTDTAKL